MHSALNQGGTPIRACIEFTSSRMPHALHEVQVQVLNGSLQSILNHGTQKRSTGGELTLRTHGHRIGHAKEKMLLLGWHEDATGGGVKGVASPVTPRVRAGSGGGKYHLKLNIGERPRTKPTQQGGKATH
jgi:hypothetical protein